MHKRRCSSLLGLWAIRTLYALNRAGVGAFQSRGFSGPGLLGIGGPRAGQKQPLHHQCRGECLLYLPLLLRESPLRRNTNVETTISWPLAGCFFSVPFLAFPFSPSHHENLYHKKVIMRFSAMLFHATIPRLPVPVVSCLVPSRKFVATAQAPCRRHGIEGGGGAEAGGPECAGR